MMKSPETFPCLMVRQAEDGKSRAAVEELTLGDLPSGDVLIRVAFSSLNYKDALAYRAHPGIVGSLPHVPGIDCAGEVVESTAEDFKPGDRVLVTGYDFGSGAWGGFSRFVRVPAEWVVPMPGSLDARQAMIYGTAGFTAAQSLQALQRQGIEPDRGEIVVTGATGGVGLISVALLAHRGYRVTAVTGKPEHSAMLRELGAEQIIPREEVCETSSRPLLAARWASAIDTVGGQTLATLIRSTEHRGCVAACGLVGGHELPLSVYPFILRGVTLAGIDSAKCPRNPRLAIWKLLSGDWNVAAKLEPWTREISLSEVREVVDRMFAGKNSGRVLVIPR